MVFRYLRNINKPTHNKILITSRGFSGTIYLLSLLTNIKNTTVAWKCTHDAKFHPNGIVAFGSIDIERVCFADESESHSLPANDIYKRMIDNNQSRSIYCIGHWLNLHDAETKYGYNYFKAKGITIINLIRHPIDRTHSNWRGLQTAYTQDMPADHIQGLHGCNAPH